MSLSAAEKRTALTALVSSAGAIGVAPPILLTASDYFDLAGEEFGARLLLTEGADGKQYCLRPDFTLPIAQHHLTRNDASPATYGYLGPVFRQRKLGPTEFEQAGIELLGHVDAHKALENVLDFTSSALKIYDISAPRMRLGCIVLFETLLDELQIPSVWHPRLRRRFGNVSAMEALLKRLSAPHTQIDTGVVKTRQQLIDEITQKMHEDGLSQDLGRSPHDIAERFLEKQALAAATVSPRKVELLRAFLAIAGPADDVLPKLENFYATAQLSLGDAYNTFKKQIELFSQVLPQSEIVIETAFSPRLHYYTGLVFEIYDNSGKVLVSGGQYDRLLLALGAQQKINASGCALWVNRLEAQRELEGKQ